MNEPAELKRVERYFPTNCTCLYVVVGPLRLGSSSY